MAYRRPTVYVHCSGASCALLIAHQRLSGISSSVIVSVLAAICAGLIATSGQTPVGSSGIGTPSRPRVRLSRRPEGCRQRHRSARRPPCDQSHGLTCPGLGGNQTGGEVSRTQVFLEGDPDLTLDHRSRGKRRHRKAPQRPPKRPARTAHAARRANRNDRRSANFRMTTSTDSDAGKGRRRDGNPAPVCSVTPALPRGLTTADRSGKGRRRTFRTGGEIHRTC